MTTFSWSTTTTPTTPAGSLGFNLAATSTLMMLVDASTASSTAANYWYSTDGVAWTAASKTGMSPSAVNATRYGASVGTKLLIVYGSGTGQMNFMSGTDASSWSTTASTLTGGGSGTPPLLWSGANGGHAHGGGTSSANLITTPDGTSLSRYPYSSSWRGGASNGTVYINCTSGSSNTYYRRATATGTASGNTFPATITVSVGICHNGNVFVVPAASTATCYTSTTGATGAWTAQTLPTSSVWSAAVGGGGTIFVLNNTTTAYQSDDDGATWSTVTLPSAAQYGGYNAYTSKFYFWSTSASKDVIIIGTPSGGGTTKELTFSTASTITHSAALRRTRALPLPIAQTETVAVDATRNRFTFTEDLRDTILAGVTRPWQRVWDDECIVTYPATPFPTPFDRPVSRLEASTTGSAQRSVGMTMSASANEVYTMSCFAKADQCEGIFLEMQTTTPGHAPSVAFQLVAGDDNTFISPLDYGIEYHSDGWVRLWMTASSGNGTGSTITSSFHLWDFENTTDYTAMTLGEGFFITGMQLERGSLTPYQGVLADTGPLLGFQRKRNASLTCAETQTQTTALRRTRNTSFAVVETQTMTAGLNRLRRAVLTLAEVFNYSVTLAGGGIKTLSFAVSEVVTHAANVVRARRTSLTVTETQALNAVLRRARRAGFSIAEVESITATVNRAKLMSFVVAQTQTHAPYWLNRARRATIAINELEAVQASFNRARAFVVPINETVAYVANLRRLRRQVLNIAETQGVNVALNRVRTLVQNIANSTGYSFTLTTYGREPTEFNVLVEWTEWTASANGALSQVKRAETLTIPRKQDVTLTLPADPHVVLIVPTNTL